MIVNMSTNFDLPMELARRSADGIEAVLLWDRADGTLTVVAAEPGTGWSVSIPVVDRHLALAVLERPADFDTTAVTWKGAGRDVWQRVRSAQASYARRQARRRRTGTGTDP